MNKEQHREILDKSKELVRGYKNSISENIDILEGAREKIERSMALLATRSLQDSQRDTKCA